MPGGEQIKTAKRSWGRNVAIAAIVVVLAMLLFNPVTVILGAYYVAGPIAYYVVPACRTREYVAGDHLGFRIGMSPREALAALQARYAGQRFPLVFITDPSLGPNADFALARNAAEVAAKTGPDRQWSLESNPTCVVSRRSIEVQFKGGRITKIVDAVNVDWI